MSETPDRCASTKGVLGRRPRWDRDYRCTLAAGHDGEHVSGPIRWWSTNQRLVAKPAASETPEGVAACTSRDCQFVHDHSRPATPEDVYRAAARTRATREGYHETLEPDEFERLVDHYALRPNLRDAVDIGRAAGREAAAQAVLDWAARRVAWDDGLITELADIARGGR